MLPGRLLSSDCRCLSLSLGDASHLFGFCPLLLLLASAIIHDLVVPAEVVGSRQLLQVLVKHTDAAATHASIGAHGNTRVLVHELPLQRPHLHLLQLPLLAPVPSVSFTGDSTLNGKLSDRLADLVVALNRPVQHHSDEFSCRVVHTQVTTRLNLLPALGTLLVVFAVVIFDALLAELVKAFSDIVGSHKQVSAHLTLKRLPLKLFK